MSDIVTEIDDNEIFQLQEAKDPLQDLDLMDNTKYYRLNETVFAEPFPNINTHESMIDEQAGNEVYFVDNIIVQKRAGKRSKYHLDVDKNASGSECPQTNCQKSFATSTLLRAHIRKVHCAERNKYICEHCGSGFTAKYLLERHMAVHSGQRIECPVCGKTLSIRTNLSVHLRWHSNTRAHVCQLCRRTFVRRATLNTHVRFVHRTGDLKCDRCDERFSSRKLLTSHRCHGKQQLAPSHLPP